MSDDTSRNSDEFDPTRRLEDLFAGSTEDNPELQGLLAGDWDAISNLGTPTTIFFIEDDGPADPVAIITALKLLGISPLEAMDFAELILRFMTAPLFLIEDTTAPGYGPIDGYDEFDRRDVHRTAEAFGIPLPIRHVGDDDSSTRSVTDCSHSAFDELAARRNRQRGEYFDQMRRGEVQFGRPIDGGPFGFDSTEKFVTSMARRGALLTALTTIGQLTPDVDAEAAAQHAGNVASAFVNGRRLAEQDYPHNRYRLRAVSDQGSMPPYIEATGPDNTPDASA